MTVRPPGLRSSDFAFLAVRTNRRPCIVAIGVVENVTCRLSTCVNNHRRVSETVVVGVSIICYCASASIWIITVDKPVTVVIYSIAYLGSTRVDIDVTVVAIRSV